MIDILNHAATLCVGLLAGALLTEGAILVPYWRRMEPGDFLRLHSTMGPHLFRYFAPLTIAGVMLPTIAAATAWATGAITVWHAVAAALCLSALVIFFLYFKAANESFAKHSITEEELPAELTRWATWHGARTVIVIAAFLSSLIATASA